MITRYRYLITRFICLVLASLCLVSVTRAQTAKPAAYPNKPVRIIVGFAAGGATDVVGRIVAQKLGEASGGSFIVENRPGASATLAAEMVAKSVPDGYTLMIAATTSHSVMPGLTKLSYDPVRDFGAISQLATSPLLLALHPSLPVRSIGDLAKLAKARPGQLTFGTLGLHLITDLGVWWQEKTGLPLPLGGNVVRRDLGNDVIIRVSRLLRQSIQYALDHRDAALEYALKYGRDLDTGLADRFVGMYVNHYTLAYGEAGKKGIEKLFDLAFERGLIPNRPVVEY